MSRLSIFQSHSIARIRPRTLSTHIPFAIGHQRRSYAEDKSNTHESSQNTQQNSSSNSKGGNDAKPKILNEGIPAEESEDVRRHNEDMAKRHDRAETHADDESIKVDKKYWSGIGGAAQDK